jgi:hypothetical protein
MWETAKIEKDLEDRLKALGSPGEVLYARYISARSFLNKDILPWIRSKEPDLTDHGPEHIKDVLDNVYLLIGDSELNEIELYILCQSVLFHDVGNLFGRVKHNQAISNIYGAAFSKLWLNRQEMALVVSIGRSHSGKSVVDGSNDTLKDLQNDFYEKTDVRAQYLAAILRFADELAEGQQRTSSYLTDLKMFEESSQIYHMYAKSTQVHIDRGGSRVALSYHIELDKFNFLETDGIDEFIKFMKFIYARIHKLDDERRYCKHYCSALTPFKKTSISFTFWNGNQKVELSVPPVDLDDLFVPGSDIKDIEKLQSGYGISEIVDKIKLLQGEDK